MTVEELLPALHELNRSEKWQVMQFLVVDLAREEDTLLTPGTAYPVWSPYDAFEAAEAMLQALKEEGITYG